MAARRGQAPGRRRQGSLLAAAGTWPTAVSEEQPITPDEGYLAFVDYAGASARRQYCSGLHVHVGVCEPGGRAWSGWRPCCHGCRSCSRSRSTHPTRPDAKPGSPRRVRELLTLLPRSGAPPVFASYAEWERFAERLVELGLADQITRIWWDVRPHPRYGTLEMRMPDQPTRLETTRRVRGAPPRARRCAAEPGPPADRGLYAQNRWAALRFGAEAELVHPDDGRLVPARALLDELATRLELDGTGGLVNARPGG